jgi:molybdopterin-guanine dinucleotide biosynthesis protein A
MGRPKALLSCAGESLLLRTIRIMGAVTSSIAIVGAEPDGVRSELKSYCGPCSLSRVEDAPNARGPIAGILGALRHDMNCDWLVTPCDMPAMTHLALTWLVDQHVHGVAATVGMQADCNELEPLPAIYASSALAGLEKYILNGSFALREMLVALNARRVAIPNTYSKAWMNINDPREWAEYCIGNG